jgi:hypothetical protein
VSFVSVYSHLRPSRCSVSVERRVRVGVLCQADIDASSRARHHIRHRTRLDPIGPALSLALHLDRADASCKTSHSVKYLAIKTSKPLSQAHEARARCVAYSAEPAESKRETKVKSCGTLGTLYARLAFWAGQKWSKADEGKEQECFLEGNKVSFCKGTLSSRPRCK